MSLQFDQLIKDIHKIDSQDIMESWLWKLQDQDQLLLVSVIGDMFFIGNNSEINWLDVGSGELQLIAQNIEDFKIKLQDDENIENWFLESIVEDLYESGLQLKENEVFGYIKLPIMGGDYDISNFEPIDMSVHFTFAGQIHEQIKDLPNGTKVKINVKK
jgi:hypothetical protein